MINRCNNIDTASAASGLLVSVVIPVYNVSEYLDDCVLSVVNQSYQALQIILIDDGATDGSGEMCDEWACKDGRIEVIHEVNSGLSAARNTGMRYVRGEYCLFVDSDDYLGKDHITNLLYALKDTPNAVVITGFTSVSDGRSAIAARKADENTTLSASEAISISVTDGERFGAHAWGKLYPKALYSYLEYPIGRYYEDQFVTYIVFLAADSIVYENANDYYYRQNRSGSISAEDRSRELDYLDAIRRTHFDVERLCPPAAKAVESRYLISLAYGLEISRAAKLTPRFDELFEEACAVQHRAKALSELPLSTKARFALLALGKGVYARVLDATTLIKKVRDGKLANKVTSIIRRAKQRSPLIERYSSLSKSPDGATRAFLIMTPRYRNYGDHLIAYSELNLLMDAGAGDVVEIPYEDCAILGRKFGKLLNSNDIVCVTGGGYLGDLWPGLEKTIEDVLAGIPESYRVVFLPETIFFGSSQASHAPIFSALRRRGTSTVVLAREKKTYKLLLKYLPSCSTGLFPDVGMLIDWKCLMHETPERNRNRALVCMRKDKEGVQHADFGPILTEELWRRGYSIRSIDTHSQSGELLPSRREEALQKLISEFASAAIVVTNRLHGMILAMIAGTPCVVLDNVSGKISGVADWVDDELPVVLATEEEIGTALDEVAELSPACNDPFQLLANERRALVECLSKVIDSSKMQGNPVD